MTSDHFAAPGQLKLRFSSLFGLDPWHGVPGVMAGRIAGPRGGKFDGKSLAASSFCDAV